MCLKPKFETTSKFPFNISIRRHISSRRPYRRRNDRFLYLYTNTYLFIQRNTIQLCLWLSILWLLWEISILSYILFYVNELFLRLFWNVLIYCTTILVCNFKRGKVIFFIILRDVCGFDARLENELLSIICYSKRT